MVYDRLLANVLLSVIVQYIFLTINNSAIYFICQIYFSVMIAVICETSLFTRFVGAKLVAYQLYEFIIVHHRSTELLSKSCI